MTDFRRRVSIHAAVSGSGSVRPSLDPLVGVSTCLRNVGLGASAGRSPSLPLMTSGRERVDEVGRVLVRRGDRYSFRDRSLREAHLFDELLHLVA